MSEASHKECPVCGLVEYACICDEEPVVAGGIWKARCQVLAAENADLRRQITQRGARLQILHGWLLRVLADADGWFDKDGVPR